MPPLAQTPPALLDTLRQPAVAVGLAVALGAGGLWALLPRPRGRRIALGVALTLVAGVLLGVFAADRFAGPGGESIHDKIYAGLFWLFASVAVSFAVVMVSQQNPARGAMAFCVSVLATCGLFLLLAAPFLMAATVVVYAGATIVTFLFVLMLSSAGGPSDENDRSREPLLGSVAGLGFAGLVLFTLYLGSPARAEAGYPLPAEPVTAAEKAALLDAADAIREAATDLAASGVGPALAQLEGVLPPMRDRLRVAAADARTAAVIEDIDKLAATVKAAAAYREIVRAPGVDMAAQRQTLAAVADGATLLAGRGELPARNVAAVGYSLYSEHLLTVELAGALLLVATVGAVAVAGRGRGA